MDEEHFIFAEALGEQALETRELWNKIAAVLHDQDILIICAAMSSTFYEVYEIYFSNLPIEIFSESVKEAILHIHTETEKRRKKNYE